MLLDVQLGDRDVLVGTVRRRGRRLAHVDLDRRDVDRLAVGGRERDRDRGDGEDQRRAAIATARTRRRPRLPRSSGGERGRPAGR